jgi:hypothetical protein
MPLCLGNVVDLNTVHNMWESDGLVTRVGCVHAGVTELLLLPRKRAKSQEHNIENQACPFLARPLSNHYAHSASPNLTCLRPIVNNSRHNRSLTMKGSDWPVEGARGGKRLFPKMETGGFFCSRAFFVCSRRSCARPPTPLSTCFSGPIHTPTHSI